MSNCHIEILKYQNLILEIIALCGVVIVLLAFIFYRAGRSGKRQAIDLERLVHDRTFELKKYVETLQRAETERNFVLNGISKRINACLATMKGLNGIAATYENMPPDLVKNIDITTDTLADILLLIAKEKMVEK
jgi:hypothetical protein